jgi:cholesterol transport system auxiliary component
MKMMTLRTSGCVGPGRGLVSAVCLCLALFSGCAALRPETATGGPTFYSLDRGRGASAVTVAHATPTIPPGPTLIVSVPRAAAGFDSKRLIYVRQQHRIEYFAHSEWIDTPARMLSPLVLGVLRDSGAFRAVVPAPGAASGDLRLDSEIVMLQHEFSGTPSRVRFVLRASLVEDASRRVLASREFEAVANAPSENPYGGVVAANKAAHAVLEQLAAFCIDEAVTWQRSRPGRATSAD